MSDKLYRILVTVLLAGIFGLLAYEQFKPAPVVPAPSEACEDAIRLADVALAKHQALLTNLPDSYQNDVYDRAENINQQLLLSAENQFILTLDAATLQAALAKIQLYCE